ncbi:MAG: ABC transporter permease [Deltaproteobacteria bacterium]|nr:ABC transporter permease [Deltaproteobacteria bacterium]
MSPVLISTVAVKEFKNSIRNRWIIGVSLILAVMALAISYFGFSPRGETGFGGFDVTIVSLASLVTYLIPIIALTLGFDTVVGEAEGKTLELILTMPINKFELYLGKFIGLSLSIVTSTVAGFGIAGAIIAWKSGTEHISDYIFFIISAILLGLAFLSLALMISVMVKERSKAIGWVIFFWFFFVLIFDLVLIGILVATEGKISTFLFSALLYANPADLFRLLNLASIESVKTAYGLATITKGKAFSQPFLYGGMFIWIIWPLLAGYFIFRRRNC